MDWHKTYSANGNFCADLYFVELFGIRPNILTYTFNGDEDKCDFEKITPEFIKSILPNVVDVFQVVTKYTVVNRESEENEYRLSDNGTCLHIVLEDRIYSIDCDSVCCRTLTKTADVEQDVKDLWAKFPKKEPQSKEAIVKLVGYSGGDYYTIESKIKSTNIDLNENYNDDFVSVHKDIIDFLNDRESGLVLLYGVPGSGKTSYIRHLVNNHPQDYIVIPSSLISRLSDPDFVTFMIDSSDSVFILEDCEQVLMDRKSNIFNGAITNILNMSDGLLSDIMNLKFICTFNADIRTIDSALLRKGRCYAKYEFKELSEDKVKHLNEKYDLGINEIKPMTLAQIYNANDEDYSEAVIEKKIGF